jgi:uncharacterized membrane protein
MKPSPLPYEYVLESLFPPKPKPSKTDTVIGVVVSTVAVAALIALCFLNDRAGAIATFVIVGAWMVAQWLWPVAALVAVYLFFSKVLLSITDVIDRQRDENVRRIVREELRR